MHSSCFVYNIAINYLWNCCLYWLLIKRYMICLIILAKVSFQDDHLHKLFLFSGSLFWVSLYAYIAKKEFLKVWLGKSTFSLKALLYFFANNESPFYKRFYCLIFLKKKKTICQTLFMVIFFISLKLNQSGQLCLTLTENEQEKWKMTYIYII